MSETRTTLFDKGVDLLVNQKFALWNYVVPQEGVRAEDAAATLLTAEKEIRDFGATISTNELAAMERAAQLLLQELVDKYRTRVTQ